MSGIYRYVAAALGASLIVGITVFPNGANLWIALGLSIALTATATAGAATTALARRVPVTATATAALGAFLIVASQVFEGASRGWLMAIAGGVVELAAVLPQSRRLRVSLSVASAPEAQEYAA